MRRLHIIGIGAGNPEHLTLQAVAALKELDAVFLPDKGAEKAELKRLRTAILERHGNAAVRTIEVDIPTRGSSASYRDDVEDWHAAIAARYEAAIRDHLAEGERGGFLVWGDPSLYDSTLRIVERIAASGLALEWDVIPGIGAPQALAAAHRVALNRIGESVAIVPGRRLEEAWAAGVDTIVVMLDGEGAWRRINGEGVDIFWGAYAGMAEERLVAGPLSEVAVEIDAVRQAGRDAMGWVMDSYILRRRRPPGRTD